MLDREQVTGGDAALTFVYLQTLQVQRLHNTRALMWLPINYWCCGCKLALWWCALPHRIYCSSIGLICKWHTHTQALAKQSLSPPPSSSCFAFVVAVDLIKQSALNRVINKLPATVARMCWLHFFPIDTCCVVVMNASANLYGWCWSNFPLSWVRSPDMNRDLTQGEV